ncbi:SDR family NAD(P)-dependent oxidoreductase [Streptomyces hygroscopicus]|uniref:SDR family NAD(P)-dependent oxidoreductase n=1 Tax=Streptomyces hygroscopicus TaxID=1912 RepID=UPI0027E29FC7|nr:SDR family NAD(P)-dependent oxidoreductase [Streptomyces hygroscopicus]
MPLNRGGDAIRPLARQPRPLAPHPRLRNAAEAPVFGIPDGDRLRFFEINALSGVRLACHRAPRMARRGWGRVIFVSSEAGLQTPADMVHYGMTKTAQPAVGAERGPGGCSPTRRVLVTGWRTVSRAEGTKGVGGAERGVPLLLDRAVSLHPPEPDRFSPPPGGGRGGDSARVRGGRRAGRGGRGGGVCAWRRGRPAGRVRGRR